jgi:hypothetical protein
MVDRDAPRIEAVLLALETYTHDTPEKRRADPHVHAQDCDRDRVTAMTCPCGFVQRWLQDRPWVGRPPCGCRGAVELTDEHYIRRYWGADWDAAPQENRHGL